jgi:hypothetical protein
MSSGWSVYFPTLLTMAVIYDTTVGPIFTASLQRKPTPGPPRLVTQDEKRTLFSFIPFRPRRLFSFRTTSPRRPTDLCVPCWAPYFNKYIFFGVQIVRIYTRMMYWRTSRDEIKKDRTGHGSFKPREGSSSCLQQTAGNDSIYTKQKANE